MNHLKSTLSDCYRYREVLFNLLSRDLKLKYKRTVFGAFWSLLNPILQLGVLTLVFSQMMRMGSMKSYSLYLFSGLVAWTFFQGAVFGAASSLLENENFIKKIYLPKLIFPLSKVGVGLVDFAFALLALVLIAIVARFPVKPTAVLLPAAVFLLFAFSLGLGIFFSVFTVYLRDLQYLLGVGMQLLYFATPVLYPLNMLPASYQKLMQLNPLYHLILLFQKLVYWGEIPSAREWAIASGLAAVSLTVGLLTLVKREQDLVFRM